MKCPSCGMELRGNAKFCDKCGAVIKDSGTNNVVNNIPPYNSSIPPMKQKPKKPVYKKWWFWLIIIIVACAIIGSTIDDEGKNNSGNSTKGTTATTATTAATEKVTTTTVQPTTKNAKQVENSYKKSCKTIDYKTLSRNPDKYKGEKFKFTGQVIQVQETKNLFSDTKTVELRVNVTKGEYGLWNDTIYATYEKSVEEDRVLENDIITIWGQCEGLYTYKSVLGSNISLPKIDVEYYSIEN